MDLRKVYFRFFGTNLAILRIKSDMKFAFLFLTILFSQVSVAQNSILGSWKGVMYRDGYDEKDAFLFYLDLVGSGSEITGKTRNEIYMTDLYAVKKIKGSFDKNKV